MKIDSSEAHDRCLMKNDSIKSKFSNVISVNFFSIVCCSVSSSLVQSTNVLALEQNYECEFNKRKKSYPKKLYN